MSPAPAPRHTRAADLTEASRFSTGSSCDSRSPIGRRPFRKQLFWLSDEEWNRVERLLLVGRRGARRVDDRRVISGIIHMLRSGARWRDCPPEYGPYTTIYNRFNRWSREGIWLALFKALTGSTGVIGTASIDSSHVKAHRSAAGGKGGPSKKA